MSITFFIFFENREFLFKIMFLIKAEISKVVTTLYRYVNNGYLTTKKMIYHMLLLIKKKKIDISYLFQKI